MGGIKSLFFIFLALLLNLHGLPSRAADLKSVYDLALKNDPVFGAEQTTYKAELESVPQARSVFFPQISASVSAARNDDEVSTSNPRTTIGAATFNSDQIALALNQSIFDKSLIVAFEQSKDQAALAELILNIARQDLIFRVAQRYFNVLGGQDNLDLAQREKKAIGRQLELAQERLNVGLGTTTDLYDAQARFKLAEVGEIDAINFLADAKQSLVELIGEYPGELKILKTDTKLTPPLPNDMNTWVQKALRQNLSIAVQRKTSEVTSKEIERQRSGHYPSVDFSLTHVDRSTDGGLSGFTTDRKSTTASFELSIPIYQGGLVTSRTTEASLRHQTTLKDLDSQLRQIGRSIRSTFLDVTSGIARVSALNQAVTASKSAVEAKQEGFAAGLNTNIDVLDAQSDLYTAIRDYLLARYTYILDSLRLESLVGTLGDENLIYFNNWLHSPRVRN